MIKPRPLLLTLACLFLVLSNCYHLARSFEYLNSPVSSVKMERVHLPKMVQVVMFYLNLIIVIVSAMVMLHEANWGRWLYVGWGLVETHYQFWVLRDMSTGIMALVIYLCCALIFLMPSSSRYFTHGFDYYLDEY